MIKNVYLYHHSTQALLAWTQNLHCSYNKSNAREKASSRWIDETTSSLVPFVAVFHVGNRKKLASDKSRE
jgi:hypothetical protein